MITVWKYINGLLNKRPSPIQFIKPSPFGSVRVQNNMLYIADREQCSFTFDPDRIQSETRIVDYALLPQVRGRRVLRVLNIGLGCGKTLTRILEFPRVNADVVELNPVVVEANRKLSDVSKDIRVNLKISDGINFLRSTKKSTTR